MEKKLVYLEWRDACTKVGWVSKEDSDDCKLAMVYSIGFVLKENDEYITISHALTEHSDVADPISIDKASIVCRKDLDFEKIIKGQRKKDNRKKTK